MVPSVDPSSTTMTSAGSTVCANALSSARAIQRSRFRTGITTETFSIAADRERDYSRRAASDDAQQAAYDIAIVRIETGRRSGDREEQERRAGGDDPAEGQQQHRCGSGADEGEKHERVSRADRLDAQSSADVDH